MQKTAFLFFIIFCSIFSRITQAQTPRALSSSEILLDLKRLNVLGSVLYIAAHPDDENTRLLSYFAKEKLYRTGYLSLTRGDGGQNLIGNEQGIELGLIRTQELLSARRIDGAEQFFSRAYDFGFSKSTEEALKIWNKNMILSDVVWVIRRFQPDIIITRFPQDNRAGHGHHSASAVLAAEAFTAAADPSVFPEQLKFVKPWQAKRILWNTFNFSSGNTQSDDQFKMDVGMYNPLLGKGYGEISAESRSQHKSQGFGIARQRGPAIEYFVTWKGDAPGKDLFDGVNTSWSRIKGGELIQQKTDSIIRNYSLLEPGKSVRGLIAIYRSLKAMEDSYWKNRKMEEIQRLIESCSGLWMEASTTTSHAIQTDSLPVNFFFNNRNGNNISVKNVRLEGFDSVLNKTLESNQNLQFRKSIYIPSSKPVTQPYWLENEMKEGHFDVQDQHLIGNADSKPAFEAVFRLNIEGEEFTYVKPVRYKYTDPVKGELYEPVYVYPRMIVYPSQKNVFLDKNHSATIDVNFKSFVDTVDAQLHLGLPEDLVATGKGPQFNWKADDVADKWNRISFSIKQKNDKAGFYREPVKAEITMNGHVYAKDLKEIRYEHIPAIVYFQPAKASVISLNLKIAGKNVGYIEGAGDYVPTALTQMGYNVTILDDHQLASADLSRFDAIITGIRAYNIKESLNIYYEKLMKYIENGGNLIVQYNTSNQIGPLRAKIGPYPFNISRTRVTDEKAALHILKPDHRILNYPNKITPQDFNNWIQERSIYHAQNWDKRYESVFAMSDAGEKDDEGSLITASYGKGNFIYTGLVFFRELPAGVPGAYRLLANLIALNK